MQIKYSIYQTLDQLTDLLHQIPEDFYCKSLEVIHHQTIGKHIRHVIEFYQCLISYDSYVCYDERKRDHLLETSILYAVECIEQIIFAIKQLNLDTEVIVKQLINNNELYVKSTIGRELLYCIDHCIHHFAIIKIAINTTLPNFTFDKGFGVAYSTLKFQKDKNETFSYKMD